MSWLSQKLRKIEKYIEKQLDAHHDQIVILVDQAVAQVEREVNSTDKKSAALKIITATLSSWGISVKPSILNFLLEQAVTAANAELASQDDIPKGDK